MSYPKGLKYVMGCPVHTMIYDECVKRLEGPAASFSKDKVLHDLNLTLMAHSIVWDRLREWMEGDGFILTPVAEKYFTTPSRLRANMSEADKVKFVCIGRAKRCVGYARAHVENGALTILWANQKLKITNGTQNAAKLYVANGAAETALQNPAVSATMRLGRLNKGVVRLVAPPLAPVDFTPPDSEGSGHGNP